MSSIDMLFQSLVPEASPAQPRVHAAPVLKEAPGLGELGTTSARDKRAAVEARAAVKTMDVNMAMTFLGGWL